MADLAMLDKAFHLPRTRLRLQASEHEPLPVGRSRARLV